MVTAWLRLKLWLSAGVEIEAVGGGCMKTETLVEPLFAVAITPPVGLMATDTGLVPADSGEAPSAVRAPVDPMDRT